MWGLLTRVFQGCIAGVCKSSGIVYDVLSKTEVTSPRWTFKSNLIWINKIYCWSVTLATFQVSQQPLVVRGCHIGQHRYRAFSLLQNGTMLVYNVLCVKFMSYFSLGRGWMHSFHQTLRRMDYTVHGILQARILEWVTVPFSRSAQPRHWTQVSRIAGWFYTIWTTREALPDLR